MNIHESAHSYLLSMLQSVPFEQTSQTMEYIFSNPSSHWLLPLYSYRSFGENGTQIIPVISALIALQTAILLVDDLLDNDGRREALELSVGECANLSTVFHAISIECITKKIYDPERQIQSVNQINKTIVETAYGQYLDNRNPDNEESYWRAARAKSCPFFGLAFYLGAVAAGASVEKAEATIKLGRLYGEMIQIHDDLNDSLSISVGSDWIQRKNTLPILFAHVVNHPEHQKFLALSENITGLDQVREAQEILLHCGAVSYCIDEIVQRHKIGKLAIAGLNLPNSQPLDQVFDEIIEPVWKLLEYRNKVFCS